MQRILTEEEITALVDAGVNMNGVPPGAEATPDEIIELERLGLQPVAAPVATSPAPITLEVAPAITDDRSPGGNLAVETTPAASAVTSPAPAADGMATLQQLLAAQATPATPADPYENLSKTQRRMLAFAGLADAGAALQGIQGGNVNSMLGRFNEQADMQRKATAAQAQQQMIQGIIADDAGTDPQARIQRLLNIGLAYPSMAPAIALQVKQIQDQVKAASGEVTEVTTAQGQIDLIQQMKGKVNYLTTGPIGMVAALAPWSDAAALRNMAVTLESNLAFSTLVQLKKDGGTLGAVSEKELDLLKAEIAKFNADMKPEDVIRQLETVDKEYRRIIRRAFETSPDANALASAIGGRPAWLDAPAPAGTRSDADLDAQYGGTN
jgi:DNA-binding TFAR19-related protein (PDSD5 family)